MCEGNKKYSIYLSILRTMIQGLCRNHRQKNPCPSYDVYTDLLGHTRKFAQVCMHNPTPKRTPDTPKTGLVEFQLLFFETETANHL